MSYQTVRIAASLALAFGLAAAARLALAQESPPPAESSPPPEPAAQERPAQDMPAPVAPQPELSTIPVPETPAPAGDAQASAEPTQMDEVIVTANRRSENMQKVSVSMTVFDGEQISKVNMTNSADIARYTPSLSANTRFGEENATFTIRGFTQDLRTTASVGTYFAEVVAPRGQSTQGSGDGAGPGTLFDLENIQVLKGPQGTLFGRNTTGGAILLAPHKPTQNFEGTAELTGSALGGKRGQFIVNVPVADALRIRFGIDHNERDGYLYNALDANVHDLNNVDYTAGRMSGVWDVTDTIENYTIVQIVNSSTHGSTARLYACNNPFTNLSNPSNLDVQQATQSLITILQTQHANLTDPIPGVAVGSPLALLTFQSCEQQLADQQAAGKGGFYDVESSLKTQNTRIKENRFINTTTWTMTGNATLKNIMSYAHLYTQNASPIFGNYFPDSTDANGRRELGIGDAINRPDIPLTNQASMVEEIQLQGTAFDERLIWQGGLYYERSKPDGFSGGATAALIYCDVATLEGDPSGFDCYDPAQGQIGGAMRYKVKTDYLNRAVYTQETYNIIEPISVTLGLRYTWDDTRGYGVKELYKFNGTAPQGATTTIQTPETKSQAPTGTLEVNWHPNNSLMSYAKYTRGYRQGTVNMYADAPLDVHQPETIDTYELGMKSTFDWLVPGRFNVALFDNTLTNMQLQGGYVSGKSGPTTAIFNAGEGKSRGFEVEAYFRPLTSVTTSFSYSHLSTRLVKSAPFCDRIAAVGFEEGFTCTPIAEVGDELPFAPRSSYVANANWVLPLSYALGNVSVGAVYAYTGKQRVAASTSTPWAMLPGFGVLNFNLGWNGIFQSHFDFNAFATNVLDKEYIVFTTGTYRPLGIESENPGQPRLIGGRLRYNF